MYNEDPLSGYVSRHLGHPLVSRQTVGLDPEVENEAAEMMGLGFAPAVAAKLAARKVAQRRQARGYGRGGGYQPRCVGADEMLGVYGLGADEDEDLDDLGAVDDDIEDLENDDETLGLDEDTNIGLGASISKTEQRISEINAKIAKLEAKQESARTRIRKRAIQMRIDKLKRVKKSKEGKVVRKREKLAAKLGIPAATLAAAGVGAGATAAALTNAGIPPQQAMEVEAAMARSQGNAAFGRGVFKTVPGEGDLVPIPILFAGNNVLLLTFPAGAAAAQTVTGTSQSIAYADFEVLGLSLNVAVQQELSAGGFPLGEAVSSFLLSSLIIAGGINQFYGTVDAFAAADVQSTGMVNGAQRYSVRLPGFRDNPRLDKTNTATLIGSFRQEIANTEPINVTIQGTLICRRLNDPAAQRSI